MKYPLYKQSGDKSGTVDLPVKVFSVPMNADTLHSVVTSLQSNTRQVIAHAKTRGEVRGGGKKPWKQKGTGRARHGSTRSPIWKGGGVTFGPRNDRNFFKKINKKVRRKALAIALSELVREKHMLVLEDLTLSESKTKKLISTLLNLTPLMPDYGKNRRGISNVLIAMPTSNKSKSVFIASKNIPNVTVIEADKLNALKVMSFPYLILLNESIESLNNRIEKP